MDPNTCYRQSFRSVGNFVCKWLIKEGKKEGSRKLHGFFLKQCSFLEAQMEVRNTETPATETAYRIIRDRQGVRSLTAEPWLSLERPLPHTAGMRISLTDLTDLLVARPIKETEGVEAQTAEVRLWRPAHGHTRCVSCHMQTRFMCQL